MGPIETIKNKTDMSYKVIRPTTHEDWLAERSKGIGSSEAGTIMGVNKFDTAYRLWRRKTGSPRLHFDYQKIDFNPSFYKLLIDTIDSFGKVNILGGVAPDAINAEDTLLKYPASTPDATVETTDEIIEKYEELKELAFKSKVIDETKASLESDIKQAMGPSETMIMPGGTVIA